MSIQDNYDVVQDMRKNGNGFKVDIVEGSWFSTVHESNVALEKKNVTSSTSYTLLVYQLPYRSNVHLQWETKDNHDVVEDVKEKGKGKGLKGILVLHVL